MGSGSYRLEETPKSQEDLDRIEEYLWSKNPEAAERLIVAVADTFRRLLKWPEMGAPLPHKKARMILVKGFPQYLVLYRFEGPVITIIRVIRGAQDWTRVLGGDLES